jgi:Uma2 family endonuclease
MSLGAFLEWDDGTDIRYELIDGHPRTMAPPIEAHGTIVANSRATSAIGFSPLPGRGRGRNRSHRSRRHLYQADLVVTCAPAERGARAIAEPRLIIEVLSPSTAAHDRGVKLVDCRKLAAVEQILMIASEDRHVEVWRRAEDGWKVQGLIGDAAIPLALDGHTLRLAAVYDWVAL